MPRRLPQERARCNNGEKVNAQLETSVDTAVSFYNNLFATEIAAFGIIAAAIFVFLQIVYSQFSYREVYGIFKNVLLISFLVISTITLLLTAAGSLLLSFPELNPTAYLGLTVNDTLRDRRAAFILLFLFLFSLCLFAGFTLSNISYIRPSRIALLISRKVRKEQIRDYLLKKYGIPAPDDWLFLWRQYGREFMIVRSAESESGEKREMPEEERAQMESQKQEFEKRLSENKKTYEKVKKTIAHAQDPLEPLDALMLRAINNADLAAINEIQSALLSASASFISNYRSDDTSKEWSPYSGITQKYVEYLTELLRIHLSMCDRQGLEPAKIRVLETSKNIARQVITTANSTEVNTILAFWKETADNAIGKSRQTFTKVIQSYRDLANYAFDNGIEDNKNWLNEIFRDIGWLGERLISSQGIEQKPLMSDHHYFNEYDQVLEALLSLSHEYDNRYPNSYPLVYFDAVYVVFRQLVLTLNKTPSQRLKENIFSCLYVYSSFAEAAIPKGNSNGAALAVMRLKEGYEKLISEGLEERAKEAIGLLVRLGGIAARQKDTLVRVEFLSKPIDEYIMDVATTSPFRDKVISEVWESHIHRDSDWNFVVEMGRRLGTNFGFMFDWRTGELYSDDDPRRR